MNNICIMVINMIEKYNSCSQYMISSGGIEECNEGADKDTFSYYVYEQQELYDFLDTMKKSCIVPLRQISFSHFIKIKKFWEASYVE